MAKNSEPIKIFNLNGKKIKEINDSNEYSYFVDNYYDKNLSKNFIIGGYDNYIMSYDYEYNKKYIKYSDNDEGAHSSIIINAQEDIIKIIESSVNGNIRVWNFHTGKLLKIIKIGHRVYCECLWNNDYLFVGCYDKMIKLINLKNGKVIKRLNGHNNYVINMKKINHPLYGDCLISEGFSNDQIKLWAIKNK